MERLKGVLSYDGTNFFGSQIQPGQRTVNGEIERALQKMHKGKPIRIHASGRTDAGVHAIKQTIHFDTPLLIQEENWKKALNTLLPKDIYFHTVEKVSADFHARYDAIEKEYRYYIWNDQERDVFKRNYQYHYPYPLDIERMKKGCSYLEGEHDFTSFSSKKATAKGSKVRKLTKVACQQEGPQIEFIFCGNGFLYHMVRIMVGTLLDIGQRKLELEQITYLLEKKDREASGKTAPPEGLYLWDVRYKES